MFDTVLHPAPQRWIPGAAWFNWPAQVRVAVTGVEHAADATLWPMLRDDLRHLLKREATLTRDDDAAITLALRAVDDEARLLPPEGYAIHVSPRGIHLHAHDAPGLFYAAQTLVQLASLTPSQGVSCGELVDWPRFPQRWFLADLGRSVWSMPLLRRLVRLCARLKYNGLQLHLHENELNPVRYDHSPLGSENPFALSLREYGELVDYARQYHVEIIPELESWGHCGSLLQHAPHLYGATRRHGYGHSLGIGPQTLDFLEQLYDQWLSILPQRCKLHVGLDEANWRLLDGADPALYNRQTLVQHIYERVQRLAKARGKDVTMMMWGGGPKHPDTFVPPTLRDQVIVTPWAYRSTADVQGQLLRHWVRDTKRYNEQGQMRSPFMGGAGSVGIHEFGVVEATCYWGTRGQEYPNCLGLIVTNWASNDLHGRMLNLYFGAGAAWHPAAAERALRRDMALDITYEEGVANLTNQMRNWQASHSDGDPDAIARDRGPEVVMGRYRWGAQRGQPVVPIWMPPQGTMLCGDQDAHP